MEEDLKGGGFEGEEEEYGVWMNYLGCVQRRVVKP